MILKDQKFMDKMICVNEFNVMKYFINLTLNHTLNMILIRNVIKID